ncbi:MAG TPA: ABC-F family ATP-binding cassette domain-containing protein [Micropepsaceae bacterium]|jgi:ATP-binding cassette subfamily F protein 3|nr:ABC-F family ATP-binding cassette domain-containing protein [Micropepsaceae bacterium]
MLIIDNVTVRIGGRVILDGASAAISDGRKVGLIGRNGAGKTTLLKLIVRQRESETGGIELSKSWRVGAVAQEAPAGPQTLIDTVLAADTERTELLAAVERQDDPLRLGEVHARLEEIGAYAAPARAARILAGLGFPDEQQRRPCSEFSGGWRMRVALAAILFAAPDLLLLDEPTNYLDLEGALWLEDYLKRYRGTVVLVSHDRDLLNRAVDSILHLEYGKLTLYTGNYDRFVEAREQKRALDAAARAQQEAERKRIQAFIDRFRAKASKASQAQSRMKWLEKMKPVSLVVADRLAAITLPQPEAVAPPLISLDRVAVGYVPGKPILSHMSLRIDSDDRIALLGQNGNGKSTLAKLMAGRLKPMSGEFMRARKLVTGYFAQHQLDELDANKTALETLWGHRPLFDETTARTRLGGFGFSGDKADTPIASLSGGERARLLLAITTLDKPNLLILDEPTNHLDIDAREELLTALNEYEGAVVLISHDRRLIEACADRLLLVADGRLTPYEGDLEDYKRLVLSSRGGAGDTPARDTKIQSKADQRREAADRRQALKPLKDAMDKWEREVARLHGEIEKCDAELAAPGLFTKDPSKGEKLSKARAEASRKLEAAEASWIDAAEAYEAAQAQTP